MVQVSTSRNNSIAIVIIILIVIILIIAGLIAWRLFSDNSTDPSGNQCVLDSQCPGSSICIDGFCSTECQTSNDCQSGWSCINGRCDPECQIDSDCPSAWTCNQGSCNPECQIDSDCNSGQTCNAGTCQAIIVGCAAVGVPQNIVGGTTAPGEITVSWDQAINATEYVIYVGTVPGFNIYTQSISSRNVLDPITTTTFTGVTNGTYYVKVISQSPSCPGTIPSSELTVVVDLPYIFKLCMRSNNTLCLKDTRDQSIPSGTIELSTMGTSFMFHSNPGGPPPAGNHLRSIESPMNYLDSNDMVGLNSDGIPQTHDSFVSNWLFGASGEYWTYNTTTGRIESNDGKFLTVNSVAPGSTLISPSPTMPNGLNSEWDLISI